MLSGGVPTFVAAEYDPDLGMTHGVTPEALAAALARTPDARAAFIVSPTYYGMSADVEGCARVATQAGADVVLDPAGDWVAEVRAATGGRGADIVVDPVGGERFDQSLRCTAPEGRVLVIGFASGTIPTLPVNKALLRSIDIVGVNYGGMLPIDQEFPAAAHADLMRWWAEGRLDPVISATAPLADGARLLAGFADGGSTGKPVLLVR